MNKFFSRAASVALGLASIATLSACGYSNEVRVPFHHVLAVDPGASLTLKNAAGTIRIDAWSKPTIDLSGFKTGRSEAAANAMIIDVKRTGKALTVTTDYPSGASGGGAIYRIHVPANTAVSVDNSAGTVIVNGTTSDVAGIVGAGTIDVTMARLAGTQRVTLSTTTGTVELHVPATSDATYTTHVNVGSAKSDLPDRTGTGSAIVNLSAGVGTVRIDRS